MASKPRILLAFAAVYLIWGSTYLGIRYAIETLPPLLMAAARFLLAGALLYAFARRRGAAPPARAHLVPAFVVGGLMLCLGNGGVVLAERTVPSGLAALVLAVMPLFMTVIESGLARVWPTPVRLFALALGFVSVGLLLDRATLGRGSALGILLLLGAALSWACGSFYARHAPRPASSLMGTAVQMLAGGALQLIAGTLLGEWADVHLAAVSVSSMVAFAYLVVFGSLLGFTAYAWLLQVVSPTLAATYAYVNPVVAVFLGWLLAGEPVGPRTLVAAAGIVVSVVLITTRRAPAAPR